MMQLYGRSRARSATLSHLDRQDIRDGVPSDELLNTTPGGAEPMDRRSCRGQHLTWRQNIEQEMSVGCQIGRDSSKCSDQVSYGQEMIERIEIGRDQINGRRQVNVSNVL